MRYMKKRNGYPLLNVKESEDKLMTAYEELKAWCEKHLEPEDYKDVPETGGFSTAYI